MSTNTTTPKNLQHLGLIMDGNRRWARLNGKSVIEGHQQGYKTLKKLLRTVKEMNILYVSVYAFSTENWNRSREEVGGLMKLFEWVAKHELKDIMKEELRISFIGSKANVPSKIATMMDDIEKKTQNFTDGHLGICFNYGGQQEIVDAANLLVKEGTEITIDKLTQKMYHPEFPPIDLVIRTSGEQRLSNFMLWRAAYSELLFVDEHWPDFTAESLKAALVEYANRQRRFGA